MHAKLSPSSAKRWMSCPASIPMTIGMPDEESPFALEGTKAHAVAESKLKGEPIEESSAEIDKETDKYVDYVSFQVKENTRLFVEAKVPLHTITGEEGAKGTADAVLIDEDCLSIIDLKYGQGVRIEAKNNPQLLLYAAGAIRAFNIRPKKVSLQICQPRLEHCSTWELPFSDFVEEIKKIKERAKIAIAHLSLPENEWQFTPTAENCQFCKARGRCKALASHCMKMDNTELAEAYSKADLVRKWLKAIETEMHNTLMRGEKIPGFKLVEGRAGNREWDDEEKVNALLDSLGIGDERFEKKLLSPAKAEKQLKAHWSALSDRIIRAPGKPIVAPESDKRPGFEMDQYPDYTKGQEQ